MFLLEKSLSKTTLSLAITASLACFSTLATAENTQDQHKTNLNDIEVITVRGDFREHNLQKTASSLSVLTDQDIAQRNAQNLEELVAIAPNVNFASGSQRARYYQIRGIGERSQFQEPINPSVGLIIDDIEFSGVGSIASTFDVSQTEIFRGPQGTRFGASAMAGLINITTNAPTDEFEGKLQLKAGNYNSYGAGLVLSGPISEQVKYRLGVEQYNSDGFIENTFLNRKDTNNRDELTARGKLAISATADLTIDLTAFYFNFDDGYDAFSLDNNRKTMSDQPGFDTQKTTALASKFTYTGISIHDLIITLTYADSNLGYGYDEDWAYVGISAPENIKNQEFAYWEYSSTDQYLRNKTTFTSDIRAVSKQGAEIFKGTTAWVAGLYYKNDNADLARQYTYLDSDFSSNFNTDTYAIYTQFDSQLTNKLMLTSGLRFERRNASYQNSDLFDDNFTDNMLGGKLVLAYQQDNNTLWYGQVNRGYKAGGANTDGFLDNDLRTFAPEYVWNYEAGYKVNILDNQAYIRAAIFYMDRSNVQAKISKTNIHDDGSSEFIIYIDNATSGINKGIEFESAWQVNDVVEIYGAVGLLNTKFGHFINAEGENLSGRAQAHAPNYQLNFGLNIQPTEHWLANLSFDAKDDFYFSVSHDEKSKKVELFNASISYLQDNWQLKVWSRNLFNRNYATRGFYFGNDPRDGYTAKQYTQLAEPMVFGATFDYQF
ncbi:MAG: TonB-dependent receptor [Alteromonadaceae bacterium]|nr:TonB-dependent receptor [Alteromonadaceae bacterium]